MTYSPPRVVRAVIVLQHLSGHTNPALARLVHNSLYSGGVRPISHQQRI